MTRGSQVIAPRPGSARFDSVASARAPLRVIAGDPSGAELWAVGEEGTFMRADHPGQLDTWLNAADDHTTAIEPSQRFTVWSPEAHRSFSETPA